MSEIQDLTAGHLGWNRWKIQLALVLASLTFMLGPWASHGESPQPALGTGNAAGLHLLTSSAEGFTLELRAPAFDVQTRQVTDATLDEISVSGFSQLTEPGAPQVPVKFVTLGIPPDVKPQVSVLEADGLSVETGYRLPANPDPALNVEADGSPSLAELTGPPTVELEPATGDAFYPAQLAEIVEVGRLRSQPFVQIRLNPFQYNPDKQELRVYQRLRVAVKFDVPAGAVETATVDEGPFEPVIRSLLLNYDQAKAWRVPASPSTAVGLNTTSPAFRFRIGVSQDGIYELTRNKLLEGSTGTPISFGSISLSTFQLFEDYDLDPSSEVALEVVDNDTHDRLDFGDSIRFFGRGADESELKYTKTRTYWLVAGLATGKRMEVRSGVPGAGTIAPDYQATIRIEENNVIYRDAPAENEPDPYWLNELFPSQADSSLTRDYTFSAPNRSTASPDVAVRARLVGYAYNPDVDPDHRATISLNGQVIGNGIWDGQTGIIIGGNTTSSVLIAGQNTLRVTLHLLPDIVYDRIWVDWFEVDYPRAFLAQNNKLLFNRHVGYSEYQIQGFAGTDVAVYDITAPKSPVRLAGAQTNGAGTLRFRDTDTSAQEYAAALLGSTTTVPQLIQQADEVIDLKDPSNGADYLIVTYPSFAVAANNLKDHRAADFTPLVVQGQHIYDQFGNGVLDPEAIRDFLTYAYDNWSQKPMYVILMGDGTEDYHNYSGQGKTNYVPPYLADQVDPFLGTTADENYFATVSGADILPDLFIGRLPANTYSEANAMVNKIIDYESGAAVPNEKMLFVADDTDDAGDFASKADDVASTAVPASYALSKVYFGTNYSTANSAKTAIINAINAGQRFTTYLGHSGVADWADEGLFRSSDVASLNNANSYPIVLGMTCLEGSFHDYVQDAVAETLVRAADKGAIASWSATGLGVATGHDTLNRGFFNALFKQGVGRLGPAAVVAKTDLYQTGNNLDLIHTFALLGDPALDTGIEGNLPDVNNDGRVDIDDVIALQGQWHQFMGEPYDQDGNGFIDVRDFMMVIQAWN